jgi:hypothetical protein
MTKSNLLVSGAILLLVSVGFGSSPVLSQSAATGSTVTLYSTIKHKGEGLKSCVNFQTMRARAQYVPCDLSYGSLYAGEDWDWFQSSTSHSRSVVRDLGRLNWDDNFKVPVVAPLPLLKEGETRHVTIDVSGADGADGADGEAGRDGAGADGVSATGSFRMDNVPYGFPVRAIESYERATLETLPKHSRPKRHDGIPKIDPIFTKAATGHLYVMHVVDKVSDFYVLFRVESLERGDNCTISWKLIPPPTPKTSGRK